MSLAKHNRFAVTTVISTGIPPVNWAISWRRNCGRTGWRKRAMNISRMLVTAGCAVVLLAGAPAAFAQRGGGGGHGGGGMGGFHGGGGMGGFHGGGGMGGF